MSIQRTCPSPYSPQLMGHRRRRSLLTPSEDVPTPQMSLLHSSARTGMVLGKRKPTELAATVRKPILHVMIVSFTSCPSFYRFCLTSCTARPCQRCIKRGLADTCTEGHRKKAKYLLDEDELGMCICTLTRSQRHRSRAPEQLKRSKSYATESSSEPSTAPPPTCKPDPFCCHRHLCLWLFYIQQLNRSLQMTLSSTSHSIPISPLDQSRPAWNIPSYQQCWAIRVHQTLDHRLRPPKINSLMAGSPLTHYRRHSMVNPRW
jgi:hypothetical protein